MYPLPGSIGMRTPSFAASGVVHEPAARTTASPVTSPRARPDCPHGVAGSVEAGDLGLLEDLGAELAQLLREALGERVGPDVPLLGDVEPGADAIVRAGSSAWSSSLGRAARSADGNPAAASARGSRSTFRASAVPVAQTMPILYRSNSTPSPAMPSTRSKTRPPSAASAAVPRSWSRALQYVQKRSSQGASFGR